MAKQEHTEANNSLEGAVSGKVARIGPGLSVNGELSGGEDIVVEGRFQGKIHLKSGRVMIMEKAKVEADIQAEAVFIKGEVKGNICAAGIVLISREGRVSGDITASKISIEDGAQFKGSVKILSGERTKSEEPGLF